MMDDDDDLNCAYYNCNILCRGEYTAAYY